MPAYIFTRLGKWDESINLNLRSAAAAWKFPFNGQISAQYFHAIDYLVYAYLQQSKYYEVKDIATSIGYPEWGIPGGLSNCVCAGCNKSVWLWNTSSSRMQQIY